MEIPSNPNNKAAELGIVKNSQPVLVELNQLIHEKRPSITALANQVITLNAQVLTTLLKALPKSTVIHRELTSLAAEYLSKSQPAPSNHSLVKLTVSTSNLNGSQNFSWALLPIQVKPGQQLLIRKVNNELVFSTPTSKPSEGLDGTRNLTHPPQNTKGVLNQKIAEALRSHIPIAEREFSHIQNLIKGKGHSSALLNTALKTNNDFTKHIAKLLTQLQHWPEKIARIPTITPKNIKHSLLNSGVFLEANLKNQAHSQALNKADVTSAPLAKQISLANLPRSHHTPNLGNSEHAPNDVKSLLLLLININSQLIQSLSSSATNKLVEGLAQVFLNLVHPTPPRNPLSQEEKLKQLVELDKKIHAVRSNITTNQLNALQTTQQDPVHLNLQTDLLLRLFDTLIPVRLTIEKKANGSDKKEKKKKREWRFCLEWSFPEAGKFNAEIKLKNERLNYRLWVQDAALRKHMKSELHTLIAQFDDKQLKVDGFQFVDHAFIDHEASNKTNKSLIDVRT